MKSGLIVINKEAGFTSFDVVAKLRGILHMKKIGHTGTLDPSACGVLPIVIGKATKAVDFMDDHDKAYIATIEFGKTTDTYDSDGEVLKTSDLVVTKEEVEEELLKFMGKQKQLPPMYSAKKVNGKKLYELARKGIEIERVACDIEIYDLKLISFSYPEAKISVSCSKGTYIRSLIHDLGQNLGCGAMMTGLLRTKACGFSLEESFFLSDIEKLFDENCLDNIIHPLDELFHYKKVYCLPESDKLLENGNRIPLDLAKPVEAQIDERLSVYHSDGRFAGIFKKQEDCYKPEKFFLE